METEVSGTHNDDGDPGESDTHASNKGKERQEKTTPKIPVILKHVDDRRWSGGEEAWGKNLLRAAKIEGNDMVNKKKEKMHHGQTSRFYRLGAYLLYS